jgi:hypothetical protein
MELEVKDVYTSHQSTVTSILLQTSRRRAAPLEAIDKEKEGTVTERNSPNDPIACYPNLLALPNSKLCSVKAAILREVWRKHQSDVFIAICLSTTIEPLRRVAEDDDDVQRRFLGRLDTTCVFFTSLAYPIPPLRTLSATSTDGANTPTI